MKVFANQPGISGGNLLESVKKSYGMEVMADFIAGFDTILKIFLSDRSTSSERRS